MNEERLKVSVSKNRQKVLLVFVVPARHPPCHLAMDLKASVSE